jgi:putative DNA primase/helicase
MTLTRARKARASRGQRRLARENMRVIRGGGSGEPPVIAVDAKRRPLPTAANIGLLVDRSDEWEVAYDEFADRAFVRKLPTMGAAKARTGELDEYHIAICVNWLAVARGCEASAKACKDGLVFAAKQRWFDPIKDYFRDIGWDGVRRVDRWLDTYVGVKDELSLALGRMWLISGVARALNPGCQADYMLVLIGRQGARKSSVLQELCPSLDWFQPTLPDLHNKDAMQSLVGSLIVNADEMSAFKRADVIEIAKNFLTVRADRFRAPYKEIFRLYKRRCIFAGTSNNRQVLVDPTGARRYWCVDVGEIDLVALRRDRDQLWAEAVAMYCDGKGLPWWPEAAEEQAVLERNREEYTIHDGWSATIEAACARSPDGAVTLRELATALGFEAEAKIGTADTKRITGVLIGMGWEQHGRRDVAGKRERTWRAKK